MSRGYFLLNSWAVVHFIINLTMIFLLIYDVSAEYYNTEYYLDVYSNFR